MRWLFVVAALVSCAPMGGAPLSPFPERRVVGRGFWLDVEMVPDRYRSIADDPIAGSVYLLFAEDGTFCRVDEVTYIRASDGERFPCRWTHPRGP